MGRSASRLDRKEIRFPIVSFKVVRVLSRKGANTIGIDQDEIVLAPWTTIKYSVAGASSAGPPCLRLLLRLESLAAQSYRST
jgi:hypothetical protein